MGFKLYHPIKGGGGMTPEQATVYVDDHFYLQETPNTRGVTYKEKYFELLAEGKKQVNDFLEASFNYKVKEDMLRAEGERLKEELRSLRVIKGINDFTEAEEKELDELRSALCRAKSTMLRVQAWFTPGDRVSQGLLEAIADVITSSPGPCAHAEEAERLGELLGRLYDILPHPLAWVNYKMRIIRKVEAELRLGAGKEG
jgi:hypothetical protein